MQHPGFGSKNVLSSAVQLALFAFFGTCVCVGCAADSSRVENSAASSSDLTSSTLRTSSIVAGSVAVGSAITMKYDPGNANYPAEIPYLAAQIIDASGTSTTSVGIHVLAAGGGVGNVITVQGDFPSNPDVLVVDADFNVVARATGAKVTAGGPVTATLVAPLRGTTILVRDPLWSHPMDVVLGVARSVER